MIQSSMQAIGEGDIILLLIDATKKILPEDEELFRKIEGKLKNRFANFDFFEITK